MNCFRVQLASLLAGPKIAATGTCDTRVFYRLKISRP